MNRKVHQWTKPQLAKLMKLRLEGMGPDLIAKEINLSKGVVENRLRRIENRAKPTSESKTRYCMNCRRSFLSKGNHNRLCAYCKRIELGPFDF